MKHTLETYKSNETVSQSLNLAFYNSRIVFIIFSMSHSICWKRFTINVNDYYGELQPWKEWMNDISLRALYLNKCEQPSKPRRNVNKLFHQLLTEDNLA